MSIWKEQYMFHYLNLHRKIEDPALERHEANEEISKSTKNELMGALWVESKIAEKKLVQHIPVRLHVHQLRTRLHHLLHRPPEIHVRVRRVRGHRHAPLEQHLLTRLHLLNITIFSQGRRVVLSSFVGVFNEGVGVAGRGEEEPLRGESSGEVSGLRFRFWFEEGGGGEESGAERVVGG